MTAWWRGALALPVIPAEAGIHGGGGGSVCAPTRMARCPWIPAFAGMTEVGERALAVGVQDARPTRPVIPAQAGIHNL